MKIEVKHMRCGETAFLYEETEIGPGRMLDLRYAAQPDGRPLMQLRCANCRWPIFSVVELVPLPALDPSHGERRNGDGHEADRD